MERRGHAVRIGIAAGTKHGLAASDRHGKATAATFAQR
jgi:hypothetical protein